VQAQALRQPQVPVLRRQQVPRRVPLRGLQQAQVPEQPGRWQQAQQRLQPVQVMPRLVHPP
jgi:hypothetical protein